MSAADTALILPAGRVTTASYDPTSRYIVTAGFDSTVRIWDAATGEQLGSHTVNTSWITSADFLPDGLHILTSSRDSMVRVFNWQTGELRFPAIRRKNFTIGAAISPDGTSIAVANGNTTITIFDAVTGGEKKFFKPYDSTEDIREIRYDNTGTRVITVGGRGTVKIIDVVGDTVIHELMRNANSLHTARFSPDGKYAIVTARAVTVYDAVTGNTVLSLPDLNPRDAAISPDGKLLATVGSDRTVRLWDMPSGSLRSVVGQHRWPIVSVVFSPDGKHLLMAGNDSTARIWPITLSSAVTGESIANASTVKVYPNPLQSISRIEYDVLRRGHAHCSIVDVTGYERLVVFSGIVEAGTGIIAFDASVLPSGTYFCILTINGERLVRPLSVQR